MTRSLALLALLALAACQQGGVWSHMPRDDSPDGQACRREVEQDPELRRLAASFTAGANRAQDDRVRSAMQDALPRARRACMIRRGATPPGGVEPLRRSDW
jgi:hypothetical protein